MVVSAEMPIFVGNMTKEVRHDNSCRFRLYPNKEQRELIAKTFGCCRWVYNWGLAMRKKAWEEEKKSLSLTDIQSQLPAMKKDAATSWLTSNPQPIGFSGILLAKRQNSFYCTYFLHNSNVADTKSPYPIKRLEVIRWFNQKSMAFNQSLS